MLARSGNWGTASLSQQEKDCHKLLGGCFVLGIMHGGISSSIDVKLIDVMKMLHHQKVSKFIFSLIIVGDLPEHQCPPRSHTIVLYQACRPLDRVLVVFSVDRP